MGADRPAYAMVHDAALSVPVLRNVLVKLGGLRADPATAERILARGGVVLVYPGGELDCLRSFANRHRVDLHGRSGFIRIALRTGVPIVPFVNAGGHEVYVTLHSSRRLARWSGLERLTRVRTVPFNVGLPWGFWMTGFVPYVPLPAKFTYRIGAPIRLGRDPAAAGSTERVEQAYRHVTSVMQAMLDDVGSRRRLPVLG
jgi:1-acyl-sn-glycerol-3-phosphate acyltransferase